jgi:hypothetical protein
LLVDSKGLKCYTCDSKWEKEILSGGKMNLTIEQVSKLTKLSVSTLYSYASRQKLGRKIGKKRLFSQADVQKLLKGSKKSPSKKKARPPVKKASTRKRRVKTEPISAPVAKPVAVSPKPNTIAIKSPKPSFWTRLFGGRKQQKKVSLMEAKTTK